MVANEGKRAVKPSAKQGKQRPERRSLRRRLLLTAAVVFALLSVPGGWLAYRTHEFNRETEAIIAAVQAADARSYPTGLEQKLIRLAALVERLKQIEDLRRQDSPINYGKFLFTGDGIIDPALRAYRAEMTREFIAPVRLALENRLGRANSEPCEQTRRNLKAYLMLTDPARLDVDWLTPYLISLWNNQRAGGRSASGALHDAARPLLRYYFEWFTRPCRQDLCIRPPKADAQMIEKARARYRAVPMSERFYAQFVTAVARDPVTGHLGLPPVSLDTIFDRRPITPSHLTSRQKLARGTTFEIPGLFTWRGWKRVHRNLKNSAQTLAREQWVLGPPGPEASGELKRYGEAAAARYVQQYIKAWEGFMADLVVTAPDSLSQAIKLYDYLATPQGQPYRWILRELMYNTAFPPDHKRWRAYQLLSKHSSPMPNALHRRFQNTVAMGISLGDRASTVSTSLDGYLDDLATLRRRMAEQLARNPAAGVDTVATLLDYVWGETQRRLESRDATAQRLMRPLLETPLRIAGSRYGNNE